MTPIRSNFINKISDFYQNQTSNGVYPVSASPRINVYNRTVDGSCDSRSVLTLEMQAEV